MANDKLIYASSARKAILRADPKLAYVIDNVPAADAVPLQQYNELTDSYKELLETARILDSALREYQRKYGDLEGE